jgi:D-serine deaminase-like pyridoxal phosphate-dependent protein
MVEFAKRLRRDGVIDVSNISVGSTPAMSSVEHLHGVTEARPGNYALYDRNQTVIGSCSVPDCAVTVLSSVVSSQPGRGHCVIDAGALALSKDAGPSDPQPRSMGEIFEDYSSGVLQQDFRVTSVSQEHGTVNRPLSVGSKIRILPNHSCLAVAQFDEFYVVRRNDVLDRWKIWRRR